MRLKRSQIQRQSSAAELTLIADLAPVPNSQDYDLFAIEVVQGNVGTLPELHYPLPELREHIFNWPADLGMPAQLLDAAPDRFNRTLRSLTAFGCEKSMETSHIRQRGLGPG